ncbi:MAG: carboxypeptidase-like regulatory domain-containing protein [Clostridium sp.]
MGYRSGDFKIHPTQNEQIEAVVKCPEDNRSVINGTVLNCQGKPVKDAVVKLFSISNPCDPLSICPITHTFTDEYGQFLFGPLCPGMNYLVKVWYNNVRLRPLVLEGKSPSNECLSGKCSQGKPCQPCQPCKPRQCSRNDDYGFEFGGSCN